MKKAFVVSAVLFCLVGITNAQSRFGISVQGALSFPLGSLSDNSKTGLGGFGTVTYTVANNVDLVVTAGYLSYDYKNVEDATLSKVLILGGARYYFTSTNFKPYITAEAGVFVNKPDPETLIVPGGVIIFSSTTDFAFAGGAGFLYKLGDNLDLDVNATLFDGRGDNFINVLAGVHFAI